MKPTDKKTSLKSPDLPTILSSYLDTLTDQGYATVLTKCCYYGLEADTPGLDIVTDIANYLSRVLVLFDDVIDNDIDPTFWQTHFEGMDSIHKVRGSIINLGTVLFAIVGEKLASLVNIEGLPSEVASRIQQQTFQTLVPIIEGQQASIVTQAPTLAEALHIAQLKSGHFYGLVCWNAAYLASFDRELAESFRQVGQIFGMIVQIFNDLNGIWPHGEIPSDLKSGAWSLPIAYTLSVIPENEKIRLKSLVQQAPHDESAEQQAREILIQSGAFVYWQIESQLRLKQAKELICELLEESLHREKLFGLFDNLLVVMAE